MMKHKSDPFLAQTSAMLAVLLVMYALGGDAATATVDHLLVAR
ncbi:MAG: hypothetical protein ACXV7J_05480 [Methylomonas sp.]